MTFARGTWKRCNVQFKRIGSWTKSVKSVYSRVETLNKHGIFTHGIMEGSDSRKSNNRIPVNRKFLFKPPSVYHLFAKNISAKRVRWKKNIEYKKREAGGMIKPINDIQAINNKPKEPLSLSKWNLNWKSSRREKMDENKNSKRKKKKKKNTKITMNKIVWLFYLEKNK